MVPAPPRPHRVACEARPAQGRVLRVLHPYGFRETQHWSVGHFSLVSATRTNSVCDRPLSRIGPVHTLRTRCALSVVHIARRFRWPARPSLGSSHTRHLARVFNIHPYINTLPHASPKARRAVLDID